MLAVKRFKCIRAPNKQLGLEVSTIGPDFEFVVYPMDYVGFK
jgi:hypothetical protein